MENRSGRKRSVIPEKSHPLRAFSAEGIRGDILTAVLALVLLLCICIICLDVSALHAGGDRLDRLSEGIASLEESNSVLRAELSWAQANPFIVPKAEEVEPERVVVISPVPPEAPAE